MLAIWVIMDLFTGQLYRDMKSIQVQHYLTRLVPTSGSPEELAANRWVFRARVVKRKGKLILLIPCTSNSQVLDIIEERCDQSLMRFLADRFKNTSWQAQMIKNGVFLTWFKINQK